MPTPNTGPARLYCTARTDTPWQVTYTDPLHRERSGRAKRITKWFADEASATTYRETTNRALLIEGTAGRHFNATLRADALSARRVLDAAGHETTTLHQLAATFATKVTHRAAAAEPIGQAVAEFLQEKEHAEGRSKLTVRNLRVRLWRWIDAQKIATVGDITRERIEPLRTSATLAPQTRRNDLAAVSTFCSHLLDRRKLDHHPLKGLRRPHVPWKQPAIYTASECAALLDAAQGLEFDDVLATVAAMLYTGLRPSEVEHTRLYYGRAPVARIEGGKLRGRANRIVPLGPAAVAWLKAAGSPARLPELTRHQRNRVLAAAGLAWQVDILRHTFISHRAALVNNTAQVAREAGTSETMIMRHYQQLVDRKAARQWAALRPEER